MKRIGVTRALPLEHLQANNNNIQFDYPMEKGVEYDAVLSTSLDSVSEQLINELPDSVKIIANIGVGFDHIDIAAANRKNIMVTNTPIVAEDTADFTVAILLAHARALYVNQNFVRDGDWSQSSPMAEMGTQVHSKTVGIIGLGAIGQGVARRLQGFNMNVLYHGPNQKTELESQLNCTFVADLDEMLSQCDFVSLNCPLNAETFHLIDRQRLHNMKSNCILINTGRGDLIVEEDLINALKNNQIQGAALDVFSNEPNINSELISLPNLSVFPHIGGATAECRALMLQCALSNIFQSFKQIPPDNLVN